MPRTFTLARLMLGVSLFCILCGCAVNFPFALSPEFAVLLAPAIGITLILSFFSKHRGVLILIAFVGALYGIAAYPAIGPLLRWFESNSGLMVQYLALAAPPAIGATVAGGSFLHLEVYLLRSQHE